MPEPDSWQFFIAGLSGRQRSSLTDLASFFSRSLRGKNWQLYSQTDTTAKRMGRRWIFRRRLLRRYFVSMQKHRLAVACIEGFRRDLVLFQLQEEATHLQLALQLEKESPREALVVALRSYTEERLREQRKPDPGIFRDSMYLARLAHDIRSPLSSLSLLLETIREEHPGIVHIESCLRQCHILEQLTFDITSLESGRVPGGEQREALLLSNLITETVQTFADHLQKRQINLLSDFSRERPISLVRSHARRIINNLIFNAIKFCSSPGEIRIEKQPRENGLEMHLEDSGPGLSGSSETMFSLFRSNLGRSAGGWGLGLASAQDLAERLGGSLSMASGRHLRGARFILYLPDGQAPAKP